mgnify:CR=1 FL=1
MDIPYVPRLVNSSAVGGVLTHANGAIVIDCVYCVWALISWGPVLAMLILFNHHLVTYRVGVGNSCCVFPVIVLNDDFLSMFLYVLPIGFERML